MLFRSWQVATIQLDFNMPERFDLFCINEAGDQERVVMIHVAIMGSIERFLSILIEHYGGAFPLWLAPEQVRILPIADRHHDYARKIADQLVAADIRVTVDNQGDRLPAKIKSAQLDKIPYMLVVGDQEMESGAVNVRQRDGEQESLEVGELVEKLTEEISSKK